MELAKISDEIHHQNFLETYLKFHFHNFHFYLRMNGDVVKITFVGLEIDCLGGKKIL